MATRMEATTTITITITITTTTTITSTNTSTTLSRARSTKWPTASPRLSLMPLHPQRRHRRETRMRPWVHCVTVRDQLWDPWVGNYDWIHLSGRSAAEASRKPRRSQNRDSAFTNCELFVHFEQEEFHHSTRKQDNDKENIDMIWMIHGSQ